MPESFGFLDPADGSPTVDANAPKLEDAEKKPDSPDNPKIAKAFKARAKSSKSKKEDFTAVWKRNVDVRLGKAAASLYTGGTDVGTDTRSEINPDWSLTKTKTANLYSQVPAVQCTHENKQYAAAIPPFAKALNYELGDKRANVGVAMEESINDCVNAAGVAFVVVGYSARFEDKQLPLKEEHKGLAPDLLAKGMKAGLIPSENVPQVVDYKFFAQRGSPTDLLWPTEFKGSNFDDGDWIGRRGGLSWTEAQLEFKLKNEDKERCMAGSESKTQDTLQSSPDKRAETDAKKVWFDEIYYWRYKVDPECKSFKEIWKLVFVDGLDEAAVHEPWKGQRYDQERRKYVGCSKFPIRVLTLTYISDNPIPPSDTEAGRSQVDDMRRSRSQIFENRQRSTPLRWFDVNRIDPLIQQSLMRGIVQGMIPTNGDGSRSIGEIARASYPSEDLAFDQMVKADLMESWQIGPNQMGTQGTAKQTKAETDTVQANFATRIGQERGRVATYFLSIAEVLAGWMTLYSDFPSLSDAERQAMQQAWDSQHIVADVVLKIRPDAAIVLDSQQRIQRLSQFINLTAKSGFVNLQPIIAEFAELSGLDPSEVIMPPAPKSDPMPVRIAGKEDLINPMVIALLIKAGQAPTPEMIQQAHALLLQAQALTPPAPGTQPGVAAPPLGPQAPPINDDHTIIDKVMKRSRDANS